jgi:hypothetical protein
MELGTNMIQLANVINLQLQCCWMELTIDLINCKWVAFFMMLV